MGWNQGEEWVGYRVPDGRIKWVRKNAPDAEDVISQLLAQGATYVGTQRRRPPTLPIRQVPESELEEFKRQIEAWKEAMEDPNKAYMLPTPDGGGDDGGNGDEGQDENGERNQDQWTWILAVGAIIGIALFIWWLLSR